VLRWLATASLYLFYRAPVRLPNRGRDFSSNRGHTRLGHLVRFLALEVRLDAIALLTIASSLLWLYQSGNADAQYLTGAARTTAIADIVQSCLAARNPRMPLPYAEKYCQCYSQGLVDHLPAVEFRNADSPTSNVAIDREANRCYQIIRDEALRAIGQERH
jgi:hypothetical protein